MHSQKVLHICSKMVAKSEIDFHFLFLHNQFALILFQNACHLGNLNLNEIKLGTLINKHKFRKKKKKKKKKKKRKEKRKKEKEKEKKKTKH